MKSPYVLILLWIVLAMPLQAQLNGTYTIGGTAPNYATFTDAVTALSTSGISGNVTFLIRPGTYNERFSFNNITGNNASRTILFQAENGDSSSVILQTTTATNANNYVVQVNNTFNVQLRKLTINAPSTGNYTTAVSAFGCNGFRLENCRISGLTNGSATQTSQDLVQLGNQMDNYQVRNCELRGGYRTLAIYAGSTILSTNVLIDNNRFKRSSSMAFRAQYANNLTVQRNRVDSCGSAGFSAMQISYCSTAVVHSNRLELSAGSGIYFGTVYATATTRSSLHNNFISIQGSASGSTGIFFQDVRNANVYYNSVNVQVNGTGINQIYGMMVANGGTSQRIRNNSFVTSSIGEPFYLNSTPNPIETYDYNNLFNGNPGLALPPNSLSINPGYASVTDLHLIPSNLNATGVPVEITTDIDGQTRNASTPDMGADEFTPSLTSAGIVFLINPSSDSVYCDQLPLKFRLINSGSTLLSSVQIQVLLNGVETNVPWSGSLAAGQQTDVLVGSFPLLPRVANDLTVTLSNPNGIADGYSGDDAVWNPTVYQALSGIYTIGGANPSFPTFNTALSSLMGGGICGPVTFRIRNGSYNERMFINPVKGASENAWVWFEGESGDSSLVTLTAVGNASYPSTIRMNAVRFMGLRDFSVVQQAASSNYAAVHVSFGTDIRLEHCEFRGYTASSSSSQSALVAFPDSNFTLRSCRISGGSGICCNLVGTGPQKYNLVMEDNTIIGGYDDALDVRNWTNCTIRRNRITAGSSNTVYAFYGLGLSRFEISNNYILAAGAQGTCGLYLINNGSSTSLNRNRIVNNSITASMGVDIIAIGICMRLINLNNTDVFHNTIRHNSPDLDNFALVLTGSTNVAMRNNIFSNVGLGMALQWTGNTNSTSDYNVFYSGGTSLTGTDNSLGSVQAITGTDTHSVVADPQFASGNVEALSFTNPVLENIGMPTDVLTDIRGYVRSSNPDPGAFESPSLPLVSLGNDTTVCGSFWLQADVLGATGISWNTGADSSAIYVETSGTYILTASNDQGSVSDTVVVELLQAPLVDAGPDGYACADSLLQLSAWATSGSCQWFQPNGTLWGNACESTAVEAGSGWYTLVSTQNNGCVSRDSAYITVVPLLPAPVISFDGAQFTCTGGGLLQWYWNGEAIPGATDSVLALPGTGFFQVTLSNDAGCASISEGYTVTITGFDAVTKPILRIAPHPVTGSVLHVFSKQPIQAYEIVDLQGRLLQSGLGSGQNALMQSIEVSAVPSGMYLLRLRYSDGLVVQPWVRVR